MSKEFFSIAIGTGTLNKKGEWLEVFYPEPLLYPHAELADSIANITQYSGNNSCISLNSGSCQALEVLFENHNKQHLAEYMKVMKKSAQPQVVTFLEKDEAPASTPEAYLKLHLLSYRLVKPHQINLEGIFSLLPNVAWTNEGAIDPQELSIYQIKARAEGRLLSVNSVDKFPKMTDYVVPSQVRIAHTARVRLGAYVGEGTTIMHEGFMNFNTSTEGKNMIEGRVSAGVMVGEGTDMGGGCSIMGTLSGGNQAIISIGKNCLIGANAGLGISLGDRCIIEAGLYLTGGSKVQILDNQHKAVDLRKASDLSGKSELLFRRNSITGTIECLTNKAIVNLNDELHDYN